MPQEFDYYIGIDGGGTNCRARLIDKSDNVIGIGKSGAANIRLGKKEAWNEIKNAIIQCLIEAGLKEDIFPKTSLALGLAGVSSLDHVNEFLDLGPRFGRINLVSDAHIACLGAFTNNDGGIVISGTGSIGYALIKNVAYTIGGWGFEIGDYGSGAHIGRAGLRACVAAFDKLRPSSEFTSAMLDEFGGHPKEIVKWLRNARPKDYAELAPLVLAYAEKGDNIAVQIANNAAAELDRIVARLHELGAPKICLIGGLANRLLPWLAPWTKDLITAPKQDALFGALMVAKADGTQQTDERASNTASKLRKSKMYTEAKSAGFGAQAFLEANSNAIAKLADYLRDFKPRFVVTIGRGSSDHAATYAKYLIETKLGIPTVSAALSTASIYCAKLQETPSVCIVISQSGRSSDLIASVEAYKKSGAKIIAFINDEESPLFELADFPFGLKIGVEKSVAATKSFIVSLVATAFLVANWSKDEAFCAAINNIPEKIDGAFGLDWPDFAQWLGSAPNLFVLGRGYSLSIAQEAGLKFKETCGIHAEAFSSAEVRHGPKAIIKPDFPILGFATSDSAGQDVCDVANEFGELGARVFVASADERERANFTALKAIEERPELEPILMISSFYKMISQLSVKLGLNPDEPPNLMKITDTI